MRKDHFEVTHRDVMGRVGKLHTPHGTVQTPALMPVINPNIDFIEPKEMKKYGAEIVITNSYIIYRSEELREKALKKGLHGLLGVDFPVMTDSGSYQLMVYGDVEVKNSEILNFQKEIGSDVAVPLDIPTPPDADVELILEDMKVTLEREREAAEIFESSNSLISFPIQGSNNAEMRRKFAVEARKIAESYDVKPLFPIGAVVPLLDTYRFSDVVISILEVKSALPPSMPVHLFGAGHPMMFSLAAALGCDLFDSAAYALYAKDDRYMTVRGTEKLSEINEFPCCCPVCSEYTPKELRKMEKKERSKLLAKHNLYVSFQEIKTVRQAIRNKTLFELVENRIRAHPYLLEAWRKLRRYKELLEKYDPSIKSRFFYTGVESLLRPAISRHVERVMKITPEKETVLVTNFSSGLKGDLYLRPCFGIVFPELVESYPAGHAEMPSDEEIDLNAIEIAVNSFIEYAKRNKRTKFVVKVEGRWIDVFKTKDLPENVVIEGESFEV